MSIYCFIVWGYYIEVLAVYILCKLFSIFDQDIQRPNFSHANLPSELKHGNQMHCSVPHHHYRHGSPAQGSGLSLWWPQTVKHSPRENMPESIFVYSLANFSYFRRVFQNLYVFLFVISKSWLLFWSWHVNISILHLIPLSYNSLFSPATQSPSNKVQSPLGVETLFPITL